MKSHRTDRVSLTFGLIFLAIVGWWVVAQMVDLALPAVGWFLAGALILLGVLGLFGALRSSRTSGQPGTPPAEPATEPVTAPPTEPVTGPPTAATDENRA